MKPSPSHLLFGAGRVSCGRVNLQIVACDVKGADLWWQTCPVTGSEDLCAELLPSLGVFVGQEYIDS